MAENLYPYGPSYDPGACSGAGNSPGQTVDVATLGECATVAAGTSLFDMSGNVWEWVEGTARGGGFKAGSPELVCGTPGVVPAEPLTNEIGIRCCKPAP